jgi:hypothetical protein
MSDLTRIPTPLAVSVFRTLQLPPHVFEALVLQDDVERELACLCPLSSVEDYGDREMLLARHAAAAKTLATYPTVTSVGSLS